jgi:hypothetical protein
MGQAYNMYGKKNNAYGVLVEKPEADHLEDQCVDCRIILKSILKHKRRGRGLDSCASREQMAITSENCNEPKGVKTCG